MIDTKNRTLRVVLDLVGRTIYTLANAVAPTRAAVPHRPSAVRHR